LYVTGEASVSATAKPSAYVVDGSNREHLVTLTANGFYPGKDTVVYRTRHLGAKNWTVNAAPTLVKSAGSPRVEESVSPSGDVEVVVYACDGVYAASASSSAVRLPEFTTVASENNCASATTAPSPSLRLSMVTYNPHDGAYELGVLVPDQGTSGTWDLFEGNPGGNFVDEGSIPGADSFVPTQLVTTSVTYPDYATLVGYGVDSSGDQGVFLTKLTWPDVTKPPAWSDPKEITTLGEAHADFTIESMTSYNGTTDIALYAPAGSFPGQGHTLFVDEGDTSGQWSGAVALSHTTLHDKNLILARRGSGTLHATFQRSISSSQAAKTKRSGIMKEALLGGNWTTPTFMTHWFKDTPLQASLDTSDRLHVEYLRK
jgi:hypothetical protein